MKEFFDHLLHGFKLPLENPVLVFSLILFIILLSPIILRKLNIPGIIGLIISGVLIGPFGLGILEKNSAIDLFSTIGLLYIMFIAGLDLDMNEFRSNRNKSFLFGFFTFFFPLVIGFPVCYYFLNYNINASILTASMFATHTLVAYPIVSKLGVSKSEAVAITVGGTILTDTAVLIILAIIIGNSQGQLNQVFWIRLGISIVIFSAIMFLIIPRIARWFFRKLESEKHSHYIFVLLVVFFAAFLAEVAGVEPIIGAFVAGLVLNRLIPHSSALMNRIEFIGNALFIPFFLISVGMLVDISVILGGSQALVVTGTLTVVALFGKWFAAFLTQLVFGYSKVQRQLIFGLSSSHAAATLAIILVGFKAKILDEYILNGTVILILITCLVASFVTEKAAKKLVFTMKADEIGLSKTIGIKKEQILMPIANIENIEKLLEFVAFIKDDKSTNPISVLSVVSNDEEAEKNLTRARQKLEGIVNQASASETNVNIIVTINHNVAGGIARVSRETMANIIVLGWPNRVKILDKLIGGKMDNILRYTNKTIIICHLEKPLAFHKRILIFAPPLTELEIGFELWLTKLSKLSKELSIPMHLHVNIATETAVKKIIKQSKISSKVFFHSYNILEDFLVLSEKIKPDDFFVLVSARKGSASHIAFLDKIPSKLEKHFAANNRFIIYPQQYEKNLINEIYKDLSAESLNKGVNVIKLISKKIGSMFKKMILAFSFK